ncbi:natriuretic peptides A-like [Elgaria multicarinata webbii]|uniref:natriuretic peptides A-like n=1 Tax=Elgaria multicarinata webbii TaxID=159646 RepID=UPI002FCCDE0A
MGSTVPLLLLLWLVGQLQGRTKAQPIDRVELADIKALLERLEEKLQPEESDTGLGRGFDEPNGETAEDAYETLPSWEDEYAQPQSEGGFGHGRRQPPERMPAATRNKLRALFSAPRNRTEAKPEISNDLRLQQVTSKPFFETP